MLELPTVTRMSMAAADDFLHKHLPDLAECVEEYERSGNTHIYHLSDGSALKVNKFGAVRVSQNAQGRAVAIPLACFGSRE